VVGSLFSSLYGARLVEQLEGRLDPATLEAAKDSVGYTDALAAQVPGVTRAMEGGLHGRALAGQPRGGTVCLVSSAVAWGALPANRYDPLAEGELVGVG
jgi:hypothetical protein